MKTPPKVQDKFKREEIIPKEPKKENVIVQIKLINAKKDEKRIRAVLEKTDNNILKYIKSITVHDKKTIPSKVGQAVGKARLCYYVYNKKLESAEIDIVAGKFQGFESQRLFENTLNHEIGHVKGAISSIILGGSEDYANEYADKHTIISTFDYLKTIFYTLAYMSIFILIGYIIGNIYIP